MSYDQKCLELAQAFAEDIPPAYRRKFDVGQLAQRIQDVIEDSIGEFMEGALESSDWRWRKQKRQMWEELQPAICHLCHGPISSYEDFEPDHLITKGHGGGRRDDRRENLAPAHSWCNRERGSKKLVGGEV